MVTLRKRVRSDEISGNPTRPEEKNPPEAPRVGSSSSSRQNKETASKKYEQARDERIKENLLRMQKLGILDLTRKVKSQFESSKSAQKKTPKPKSLPSAPLPRRRSSRLQNVTPVSYTDSRKHGENSTWKTQVSLEEGSVPEIYTEEHEKLLGTCKMSWELFKDGYGADGKRIYDPVNGKTCHQCRQKTLGHRTHCSKCSMVQGQFCGDCLYMRYGENVLEANENPEWLCPVCRGICNCSLCRVKKGWVPTGVIYKKISSLGFKSVAHFLIQTQRSVPNSAGPVAIFSSSAKRSLHFTDKDRENDFQNGDEVDEEGNNNIIGVTSKSSEECKNDQEEEDSTTAEISKNKQKKTANQILTSQTISKSAPRLKSESGPNSAASLQPMAGLNSWMTGESKMRIKVAVSKPSFGKRLRQDDNDAGVPSEVKCAVLLLVREDGVVHFAHEAHAKAGAVSQLSSDGVLHCVWESAPKHTAAQENCSISACFGEGRAQASVISSEDEVKPSMLPQQSSVNVINAALYYRPESVMPVTASSNGICNGELGYKATGIVAISVSSKDAETQLCSDGISSVASPGKLKPTAGAMDPGSDDVIPVALNHSGALGVTDSGVALETGLDLAKPPEARSSSGGGVHAALQSELQPPETPELTSDAISIGKFGSSQDIAAACQRRKESKTDVLSPSCESIAGRLKIRRRSMSS